MCGIAGFVNDRDAPTARERELVLDEMCQVIKHRGPDDQGTFIADGVALGMRGTVVLTLTTGPDTQHAIVDDDGVFQFPGLVPPGSSYLVTTADTSCDVIGESGTNVSANVTSVGQKKPAVIARHTSMSRRFFIYCGAIVYLPREFPSLGGLEGADSR